MCIQIRIAMTTGAHAIIVADNIQEPNVFLMTDGQFGIMPAITVTSILVNKTMGDFLKNALLESGMTNLNNKH